jgi:hypothetical protein
VRAIANVKGKKTNAKPAAKVKASKRPMVSPRTYEEIRFRFILGETLVTLSEEYNISLSTLRTRSSSESWGLLKEQTGEEDKREFRRALIDKNYIYVNVYKRIRKKAEKMLGEVTTPRDLNLITQVVKIAHEQELLCFALRGDIDENK